MGRSCRDLPGGSCLEPVTAPGSQHHLNHSCAWRLLHKQGQDSHQPHSALLKPPCSGCVTDGITFRQG